jgi:hypothetical protein
METNPRLFNETNHSPSLTTGVNSLFITSTGYKDNLTILMHLCTSVFHGNCYFTGLQMKFVHYSSKLFLIYKEYVNDEFNARLYNSACVHRYAAKIATSVF